MILIVGVFLLVGVGARQIYGDDLQAVWLLGAGLGVLALAVIASYWSVAAYVRAEDSRNAEQTAAAQLDGVKLAFNTLRHQIANKLAVAVGYSEMLADDPRLPVAVQEQANKVLTSAMAAAAVVHKLDDGVVRIQLDASIAGPKLLDIDASTTPRS